MLVGDDQVLTSGTGERFRLHPAVFYRRYPEFVVLFHTERREIFTFNDTSFEVLNCFREFCRVDEVISTLGAIFEVDNRADFESSIQAFAAELFEKGILQREYKQSERRNDLERRVSDSFTGSGQLYSVAIELTYRCNERCRHCYVVDEGKAELTTSQLKTVLDDLAEMNVCNIVFTGGEIFVRKDAFELLEYAYAKGFAVDIFTNGTMLNATNCLRLKAVWPRCVHFSVYSHLPYKHDAITQLAGSFDKTVAAIKACTLIGIPVNIKTPVLTENMDAVPEMVRFAESLGVSIELGRNIVPRKDGDLSGTSLKITDEADYRTVSKVLDELIESVDLQAERCETLGKICGAGEHSVCINPYGEVYPCNTLPLVLGNTASQSIRDIWEGSRQLQWWRETNQKSKKKGCDGCFLTDSCIFCPGDAMLRTGDPLRKYEDACAVTRFAQARP